MTLHHVNRIRFLITIHFYITLHLLELKGNARTINCSNAINPLHKQLLQPICGVLRATII